jgi:DNA-binding MarR family transcriptional regulator
MQRRVLAFLDGGERRYSEIRDHLGTTGVNTTNILIRLVRYGLIVRVRRGVYRKAAR